MTSVRACKSSCSSRSTAPEVVQVMAIVARGCTKVVVVQVAAVVGNSEGASVVVEEGLWWSRRWLASPARLRIAGTPAWMAAGGGHRRRVEQGGDHWSCAEAGRRSGESGRSPRGLQLGWLQEADAAACGAGQSPPAAVNCEAATVGGVLVRGRWKHGRGCGAEAGGGGVLRGSGGW